MLAFLLVCRPFQENRTGVWGNSEPWSTIKSTSSFVLNLHKKVIKTEIGGHHRVLALKAIEDILLKFPNK